MMLLEYSSIGAEVKMGKEGRKVDGKVGQDETEHEMRIPDWRSGKRFVAF